MSLVCKTFVAELDGCRRFWRGIAVCAGGFIGGGLIVMLSALVKLMKGGGYALGVVVVGECALMVWAGVLLAWSWRRMRRYDQALRSFRAMCEAKTATAAEHHMDQMQAALAPFCCREEEKGPGFTRP